MNAKNAFEVEAATGYDSKGICPVSFPGRRGIFYFQSHLVEPMNFIKIISGFEPFTRLDKGQIEKVAHTFEPRVFAKGKSLIMQNEPISEIGLIVSGRVSLGVTDNHNRLIRFDSLSKGDFLGLETVATDADSPISALCESSTHCYFQKKEDFLLAINSYPLIKDFFFRKALLRLTKALEVMNEGEKNDHGGKANDREQPHFPRAIEKSLRYIEKNYMNPMTLDEIARVNGMSKYHFSRVFKLKSGFTFKQYLNRKRIDMAKHLMHSEDMTVSEACFAVGYNDLAYFSRVFHKLEGGAPSLYKKSLQQFVAK